MRFRILLGAVLLFSAFLSTIAQYSPPPPQRPPQSQPPAYPGQQQYRWGRPRPPATGACFFRDAFFQGDYFCLKLGETWQNMPRGFNDQISSIRVYNGASARVFNDVNFRGPNMRVTRSIQDLVRVPLQGNPSKNWNDRISSIAVYRSNDAWDRGHP
jgi:hypothetical protein